MPFNLQFQAQNADGNVALQLEAGEILFVLGANGTGKSSLMFHFAQNNAGKTRKISAHRQTWMNTDTLDMTPASRLQTEQNIRNADGNQTSRYRDDYAAQRASITIYELIDSENVRAREITAFVDAGDMEAAVKASVKEAPITIINELLMQSNIPITISIRENGRVMASKDGGSEYSAAELSDGERNALLIAGNVLTAPPATLLIIDEPERHLHRSIISPLLSQLFERRSDCGFVVSTHDHDLPLAVPGARVWDRRWRWVCAGLNAGRIVQTAPGRVPAYKRYLDEMPGKPLQDLWSDIPPVSSAARERIGYPTQKPIALLN